MANPNTVLKGDFRSLGQLQGCINGPINSRSVAEFKMSTWKCNIIVLGFCGEISFREIT